MMEENNLTPEASPRKRSMVLRVFGLFVRFAIFVIVTASAVGISYYWLTNRPRTERRPPRPEAVLVDVEEIKLRSERVVLRTMGTVVPAARIQLAARVSGQITEVDPAFVPGGLFDTDAVMLQIDKRDYELAVNQQEGNLTRTEADARIEMGQQAVARSEYELLMESIQPVDLDLLLRKPQLAAREAAVAIAESTLDKARLDLERTTIRAPFNAVVLDRAVELGSYVAPGASLATLAGTDAFWIEISVPVNDLEWITVPGTNEETGSTAQVFHHAAWGTEVYRVGHVKRLLPALEPQGRMARVLVVVEDPLDRNSESENNLALLLESFVRVHIEGAVIPDVARISRTHLHEGDTVWVMTEDNTLDIRKATVFWGSGDEVLLSEGLNPEERLVTSALTTPVQGMLLRTVNGDNSAPQQGRESPGDGSGRQQGGRS